VVLADEPTSSLDPKTSVEIMTLLREQGRVRGIPVIVNIHDVELAKRFADRLVGMSGGHVVYDGAAQGSRKPSSSKSMAARTGCHERSPLLPPNARRTVSCQHDGALCQPAVAALHGVCRASAELRLARFISGLDRGARLLGKMFPPDLSKGDILWNGMIESMQMAVLASVLGIVISLPLGLLGARNLMPQR
jgi:hypothetical protein